MIRYNYTQVEEDFQSIYNLHELLLSLVTPLCLKAGDLSFDELSNMLENDKTDDLFPDFTPTSDFLVKLNASFNHYAHQYVDVKSVNALNCRKSALLSQMLLRHKALIVGKPTGVTKEKTKALFNDLIHLYTSIFMSVQSLVFDLGPYLGYLTEYIADDSEATGPESELLDSISAKLDAEKDETR